MTCFCDIPLSKIKKHMKTYGDYGIGLNKNWGISHGISHGISPVIYSEESTKTAELIKSLFRELIHKNSNQVENQTFLKIVDLLRFVKPYKGKMLRDGVYNSIRFYDEREWRYVPEAQNKLPTLMLKEDFDDLNYKIKANDLLKKLSPLKFNTKDVKFIIIKSEDEIMKLKNALKKYSYTDNDIEKLMTKIIIKSHVLYDL